MDMSDAAQLHAIAARRARVVTSAVLGTVFCPFTARPREAEAGIGGAARCPDFPRET